MAMKVEVLGVAVSLGVVGHGERVRQCQNLAQFGNKIFHYLRPVVRPKRLMGTVLEHPVFGEVAGNVERRYVAQGDDLREHSEAVGDR